MTDPLRPSSSASPMSTESLADEEQGSGLVVVASYGSTLEAELAKSRLAAAGIPALLSDAHTVSIAAHLSQAVGGVKVRVSEEDQERAREVLESAAIVEGFDDDEEDELEEAPRSPAKDTLANRALGWSVLGTMFFPPATLYSLWLLVRFLQADDEATPSAKRRAAMALVFDAVVLVALAVILQRG